MKAVNKGFTLIELMIVVAVIGVLAAIAVPQYQNYVAKGELASALSSVTALKTNVEEHIANNGSTPIDDTNVGVIPPTNGATITATGSDGGASLAYAFGSTGSAKVTGSTLTLAKASDTGAWTCTITGGNISAEIKPKGCN